MSEKFPTQQKSAFFSFVKSLASFKGDLASLTAPPFLLSSQSIVEFSAYWAEQPSLFVAPASEPDPELRALAVLKWFLSTLKEQHSNKDENGKKKRMKPLNPFLGELFLGKWCDEETGTTRLVAEQVSHHPPVTACRIWNEEHGVQLSGHVAPKASFSTTVHIDRKGYSIYHIDKYIEDYLITMPKIHIEGIMTGSFFPELSGTTYIRSSSGYTAKINYSSKGWVSGKSNSFTATLCHDDKNEVLYTVEGQWSGEFVIKKGEPGQVVEKFNTSSIPKTPFVVADIEKQHPLESRRAWRHVVDGIEKGDIFTVGHEKSKLENEQRELRKQEKAEGREFKRRYFTKMKEDPVAEKLSEGLKGTSMKGDMDGHHGIWMWDEQKFRRVQQQEMGLKLRNGSRSPMRPRFDSGVGGIMGVEKGKDEIAV